MKGNDRLGKEGAPGKRLSPGIARNTIEDHFNVRAFRALHFPKTLLYLQQSEEEPKGKKAKRNGGERANEVRVAIGKGSV